MYQDINIHVNCTHLPPSYSRKDEILKEIGEKIFSKKKKPTKCINLMLLFFAAKSSNCGKKGQVDRT